MTRRPPPPLRRPGRAGADRPAEAAGASAPEASDDVELPPTAVVTRGPAAPPASARPAAQQHPQHAPRPVPVAGRPAARAGRAVAAGEGASPRPGPWGRALARAPRRPRVRSRSALVVVLVLVALVAVAAVVLLATPLTAVRSVRVVGVRHASAASVSAVADDQLGRPELRVDARGVAARAARLPWVRSARVERDWPHGLVVRVHEAVPVAAVATGGAAAGAAASYAVLDARGRTIVSTSAAPAGVPVVDVVGPARPGAGAAASAVARGLPGWLRSRVTAVSADGPDDVRLVLVGGTAVRWGSAHDGALKARVLAALLPRRPRAVDVSAPTAPATS